MSKFSNRWGMSTARTAMAVVCMIAMSLTGLGLARAESTSDTPVVVDGDSSGAQQSLTIDRVEPGNAKPVLRSESTFSPTVAGCPIVALPNDNSTSGSERAPNLRNRFGRSVYLIKATELAAAGITSGTQFSSIGWTYVTAPGLSGSNTLTVYLQNTADVTNLKSTTWATAITGMTVVNSGSVTIPNVTGSFDIPLSAGGAFTYTGGGLYVAFDAAYPVGTLSGTTVVSCNSTGLVNGLLGAQGTSAPATLAASSFRPETRLAPSVATILNDASVDYVISLGSLTQPLVGPQTFQAVITNKGANAITSLPVTLNVTGAESFSNIQTIPTLAACGGQATVSFAPFSPTTIGSDTLTVTVPADDVAGNNSKNRPMDETYNLYSYKHPGTTASGGVGLTGATGAFVAKFNTTQAAKISAVNLEFFAVSATTYRVAIYPDVAGVPGTVPLYVDAADQTVGAAGPVTITLPSPVAVGPGNFYVGLQQTNTTNASLSFDNETPIRSGSFYLATPNPPTAWFDFAPGNNFKLNIGVTLVQCSTTAECDDGNSCTDDSCANQLCVHTNNNANACSDGNACTTPDTCLNGACVPGTNPCDDGNACTVDNCSGGCTYNAVNCDDGNPCTDDSCNPGSGCVHANNTNVCSDGDPCTLGDACAGGVCVPGSGALPAPVQVCNTGAVTINDLATATPYPSTITVTGQPSYLCSTTVNLNGLTHTFVADVDILLARLSGNNAIIMSDVGGTTGVSGVNLTLSDAAAASLPAGTIVSGTYKPTNIGTGDTFAAPAPAPTGGSALSAFTGSNPNGTWNLFVVDDVSGDLGTISGGWCVNLVSVCTVDADCNDGNVCTNDTCAGGTCTHTNNTAACDDGNACTAPDTCAGGVCVPGTNPCDDGSLCTVDVCGAGGSCSYTPVSCDDANPCTTDSCNPGTGCVHVNNSDACSDGNACTLGDVCAAGVCVPGPLPPVVQFCNNNAISIPSVGTATPYPASIAVTAGPVVCSVTVDINGITHTFPDDIDVLLGGPAGQNAIVMSDVGGSTAVTGVNLNLDDAAANPIPDSGPLVSGSFKPTNSGAGDPFAAPAPPPLGGSALSVFAGTNPNGNWDLWVVDDASGDLGSMSGWCVNIRALCGADAECNDGNVCTDDTCVGGACAHTNNTASCSDGNACTANDTCSGGVCVGGAPPSCDDGDVCTTDSCNPGTGLCEHVGIVCNDSNPCTDDTCVGPGTGCVYTNNDANACSDGDGCTQTDACVGGACVGSNPVVCNDSNICTTDSCDPATGLCVYANNTNSCDDGNPCTTGDVCGPTLGENFDGVVAPTLPTGWTSAMVVGASGDLPWYTDVVTPDTAPNTAFGVDPDHITDNVLDSPSLSIATASAKLTFRNRFSNESTFDGSVLEISIGGGAFTDIVTAGGSFSSGGYTGTISTAWGSPIGGRSAWTGTSTGYPAYLTTIVNLPPAAAGQAVVLRWRIASDSSVGEIGQDIDTIVLVDPTNTCGGTAVNCDDNNPCTDDSCDPQSGCVHTNNTDACDDGNACTTGDVCGGGTCHAGTPTVCNDGNVCTSEACDPGTGGCVFTNNSNACDDGNPCTIGDVCSGGSCQAGSAITAPPETTGVEVAADKTTYSWSPALYATGYDAVRGLTSALPVGPGGGDEICLGGIGGASLVDPSVPAPGTAYFYLVRGRNTCGIGSYGTESNGSPRVTTTCP